MFSIYPFAVHTYNWNCNCVFLCLHSLRSVCDQQLLTSNLILNICLKYVLFTFPTFVFFSTQFPFFSNYNCCFHLLSLAFYVFKKLCLCLLFKWLLVNIWFMYFSKAIIPCNKDFIAVLRLKAKVGLVVSRWLMYPQVKSALLLLRGMSHAWLSSLWAEVV